MEKTAVITGGSRGIGAAAVRSFAAAGYRVFFLYEKSHEAARRIAEETGSTALCADVADAQAVHAAFQRIGEVDVLVNNAGVCHYGLIMEIGQAQWDRVFAVNVGGAYRCICAALPSMLHRHAGCIINVSSMWGQVGASCEVCYSATKGAIDAMTKALAKELGPSGIRVNAVSPGVTMTDMMASVSEETVQALREDTPIGRNGRPEDIANAMLYLAQAEFVTGEILHVNGGFCIT